jgi:hypothetical protein
MLISFADVTREGSDPDRSLDFPLPLVGWVGRSYGFDEPDEAGLEGPARAMTGEITGWDRKSTKNEM